MYSNNQDWLNTAVLTIMLWMIVMVIFICKLKNCKKKLSQEKIEFSTFIVLRLGSEEYWKYDWHLGCKLHCFLFIFLLYYFTEHLIPWTFGFAVNFLIKIDCWFLIFWVREKMTQAYEFALDKMGMDFNSYQVLKVIF